MKKPLIIGAVTLLALGAPLTAAAQSWGDRDRDGRYERWERRADDNRRDGRRYTERERRNDWRRGQRDQRRDWRQDRREIRRWHRGAVIPHNYRRNWYVNDYRRYGYPPPPRGHAYYRTDTGDVVLAVIATGVILSLLNN